MSDLLWEPPEGVSMEAAMDRKALRSRYTPTERPQNHPETIQHVNNMLNCLTEAQRQAAELVGMASMTPHEVGKLLGYSNPHTLRLSWYRTVEKFTGETPIALEHERERKRRNQRKVNRARKEDPLTAQERHRRWRAKLYQTERETGVTPPALAKLRERKRKQMRKARDAEPNVRPDPE